MKQTELQEIADKLLDPYSNARHYEITAAAKEGDCWRLTVQVIKDEEAENESN
jgi:hypothetical protein